MPDSDIARIAKGLTKAQRDWLLAAEPTLERVDKRPCAAWWDNPERLYVEIDGEDVWLASRGLRSLADSPTFDEGWEQLSQVGLVVRAYLEAQDA